LCQLFTTILCHCEVTGPKVFWESICEALSEDIQYKRRRMYSFQTLQLTDVQIKAYALLEIEKIDKTNWKIYDGFHGDRNAKLTCVTRNWK
jgi:hypothetical protein